MKNMKNWLIEPAQGNDLAAYSWQWDCGTATASLGFQEFKYLETVCHFLNTHATRNVSLFLPLLQFSLHLWPADIGREPPFIVIDLIGNKLGQRSSSFLSRVASLCLSLTPTANQFLL